MHSILAVDDSASMRQMVTFTLKSAGYYNIAHEFRNNAPVKNKMFQ